MPKSNAERYIPPDSTSLSLRIGLPFELHDDQRQLTSGAYLLHHDRLRLDRVPLLDRLPKYLVQFETAQQDEQQKSKVGKHESEASDHSAHKLLMVPTHRQPRGPSIKDSISPHFPTVPSPDRPFLVSCKKRSGLKIAASSPHISTDRLAYAIATAKQRSASWAWTQAADGSKLECPSSIRSDPSPCRPSLSQFDQAERVHLRRHNATFGGLEIVDAETPGSPR